MITGLSGVSVWSEDHYRLLPFYRDVLSLPVMLEAEGFAVFGQPGGGTVLIGTHSEVHGPNLDPARHIVSLGTDDIEDAGDLIEAVHDNAGKTIDIEVVRDGRTTKVKAAIPEAPAEDAVRGPRASMWAVPVAPPAPPAPPAAPAPPAPPAPPAAPLEYTIL